MIRRRKSLGAEGDLDRPYQSPSDPKFCTVDAAGRLGWESRRTRVVAAVKTMSEEPFWAHPWPWSVRLLGWAVPVALVLVVHWHSFESEDVTWLLLAADRLSHGGRWGRDILETNTPGAVLLYFPPAVAARLLPIAPLQACILWILAILIGCSAVLAHLFGLVCRRETASPQMTMAGWVALSVLAFGSGNFGLPMFGIGNNFGQRDAVIAALLMPLAWFLLCPELMSPRRRGYHRVAIVMAAVAFCIKPQFLLPLVLWFAIAAYRHGWRDALHRAGVAWLVPAGCAYLAVVLLVFPEWLGTARLAAQTYGAYRANAFTMAFVSIPAVLLLAIAWRMTPIAGGAQPLLRAATIVGSSYILLSWVEQKPWFYHQLPAVLTLLTALGLAVVARLPEITTGPRSAPAALALASVIPGLLLLTAWRNQAALHEAYEQHPLIRELRARLHPGSPWAVISASPLPGFPATLIEGYRWVLRGPSLWPLPGAIALVRQGQAEPGTDIVAAVSEGLAEDIEKGAPQVIVIDPHRSPLLPEDDMIALLSRTSHFAAVWARYRLVAHAAEFDLYVPREAP
jgi:hypothetical protein